MIPQTQLDTILTSLGEQVAELGVSYDLVLIGGAGLQALGIIDRPTRDADVVAFRDGDALLDPRPLPEPLRVAANRVAADYGLAEGWLNAGPSDLLRWGLPEGFTERLISRRFGDALVVHVAHRYDQIHLKLYAVVDQGAGRHETDLRALQPTKEELLAATGWTRTHDPSEGFRIVLVRVLKHFGLSDDEIPADLRE